LVDQAFPLKPDEVTVDYDCMISQCLNKNVSAMEVANMKNQLPIAAIRALEKGYYCKPYRGACETIRENGDFINHSFSNFVKILQNLT
jgi:hypothetical protein